MSMFTSIKMSDKLKTYFDCKEAISYSGEATPMFKIMAYYFAKAYKNNDNIIKMLDNGMLRLVKSSEGSLLYSDKICKIWKLVVVQSNFGIKANVDVIIVGDTIVHCGVMRSKFRDTYKQRVDAPLNSLDAKGIAKYKEGEDISIYLEDNDLINVGGADNFTILGKDYTNSKLHTLTVSWMLIDLSEGKPFAITPTKKIYTLNSSIEDNASKIKYSIRGSITEDEFIALLRKDDEIAENSEDLERLAGITSESLISSLQRDGNIIPLCEELPVGASMAEKFATVLGSIGHELDGDWVKKHKQKSLRLDASETYPDGTKINTYKSSQPVKHSRRDITPGGKETTVYEIFKPKGGILGFYSCIIKQHHVKVIVSELGTGKTSINRTATIDAGRINSSIASAYEGGRTNIKKDLIDRGGIAIGTPIKFMSNIAGIAHSSMFDAIGTYDSRKKMDAMLDLDDNSYGGKIRNGVLRLFKCMPVCIEEYSMFAWEGTGVQAENRRCEEMLKSVNTDKLQSWIKEIDNKGSLQVTGPVSISKELDWMYTNEVSRANYKMHERKCIVKINNVVNRCAISKNNDVYAVFEVLISSEANRVMAILNPYIEVFAQTDTEKIANKRCTIDEMLSAKIADESKMFRLASITQSSLYGMLMTAFEVSYNNALDESDLNNLCTFDCKEAIQNEMMKHSTHIISAKKEQEITGIYLSNRGQYFIGPIRVYSRNDNMDSVRMKQQLRIENVPMMFVENKDCVNGMLSCVAIATSIAGKASYDSGKDFMYTRIKAIFNLISILLCQGVQEKSAYEALLDDWNTFACRGYIEELLEYAGIPTFDRVNEIVAREVSSNLGSIIATNSMYSQFDEEYYGDELEEDELDDYYEDSDDSSEEEDDEASDEELEVEEVVTERKTTASDGFDDDDDLMGGSTEDEDEEQYDDTESEENIFDETNDTLGSFIDTTGKKVTWVTVINEMAKTNKDLTEIVGNMEQLTNMWLPNYMQLNNTPGAVENALKRIWSSINK